ncbi:CSLREA domain-containing protein [Nocardia sp. XZ_19_385]|uniref:CSLREA domain-containing protein n=1 Tax=Nocardia sp. XZ_19_385 TaxID=2769488 RepID=UPI00188FA65E|nr:CSLREA domain-containing protein [Nocardia sp. XZ_19_385]
MRTTIIASAIVLFCCTATGSGMADTGSAGSMAPQTITVTTTADGAAARPLSGECRTAAGECTLRAAIQAANVRPGSTIVVPAGRYLLTIPPNPLHINAPFVDPTNGDLDITAHTTVRGAGRDETIIDANRIDRVLLTTANVSLADLTLTGGATAQREIPFYDTGGGGIANGGNLVLDRVTVTGNAAHYGGGIFNVPQADMKMTDSLVTGNFAEEAGGVRCDNTCTFTNSQIVGNHVVNPGKWYRPGGFAGRGGGLDIRGIGPVTLISTVVEGNSASDGGGGINIAPAYLDTIPDPVTDLLDPGAGILILTGSRIQNNRVGPGIQNCKSVFAQIVSTGGNVSDDTSCALTARGDEIRPS